MGLILSGPGCGERDVSIVVPAFNESGRLPHSLPALVNAIHMLNVRSELLFVDDGSTDQTAAAAACHLAALPDARVIALPWNCGKGAAVRAGVSAARGKAIIFLDADLANDVADLPRLLSLLDVADIALGSRTAEGSVVTGRTRRRHVAAVAYRTLTHRLTNTAVVDTQCGFKAFRAPVAKLLFSMTSATGFGFDVEILTLATALGLRITEFPITWTAVEGSHVSLRRHVPGMLADLRRARRHQTRARLLPGPPLIDSATWSVVKPAPSPLGASQLSFRDSSDAPFPLDFALESDV